MRFRGPTRAESRRVWKGPLIRCPSFYRARTDADGFTGFRINPLSCTSLSGGRHRLSLHAGCFTPRPCSDRSNADGYRGRGRGDPPVCRAAAPCRPPARAQRAGLDTDAEAFDIQDRRPRPRKIRVLRAVDRRLLAKVSSNVRRPCPCRNARPRFASAYADYQARRSPAVAGPELAELAPERGHTLADPQRSPRRRGRATDAAEDARTDGMARSLSGDIMAQIEQLRACRSDVLENRNSVDVGRRCQRRRLAGSEAHAKIFRFCGRRQPDRVFHARVGRLRQRDER